MSDSDDALKSRREFLHNTVKAVTGASLPFLMGADSCDEKKECDPATSKASANVRNTQKALGNYDVIVIGSGFGATVAVTKLLERQPELKLLILERGVWWLSPDRPKPTYLQEHQNNPIQYFTRPDHSQGARYMLSILKTNLLNLKSQNSPLYYVHSFSDIDVMTAGGVGGGSLIYLNVTIPPINDEGEGYSVLRDWPLKLFKSDYDRAIAWMLKWRGKLNRIVTDFPLREGLDPADLGEKEYLYLSKVRAYRSASNVSGTEWQQRTGWTPAPLSIEDYNEPYPHINEKSKDLEVCTRLGRCFLGCLPGAIQTLDKVLLNHVLDKYRSVNIQALKEVSHIAVADGGGYEVWFNDRTLDGSKKPQFYSAKQVILAAGTLGSTEILLRSHCAENTLQLSPTLGHRFSPNGDLGGFIRGAGDNRNIKYKVYPTRGPLITSLTQYELKRPDPKYGNIQMTVEDGGIPPTLANFTRILLEFIEHHFEQNPAAKQIANLGEYATTLSAAALDGQLSQMTASGRSRTKPDPKDTRSFRTEHELLENTFYFQCMGKDEPNGQFFLNKRGRLDLKFTEPPLAHPVYRHLEDVMRKVADNMGGKFLKFPTLYLPKPRLFTLHPLGGCSMGENSDRGVVDTKGRVFKRSSDSRNLNEVYDGLYVIDASIFPGAVAVNPTLTIVALALKVVDGITVAT